MGTSTWRSQIVTNDIQDHISLNLLKSVGTAQGDESARLLFQLDQSEVVFSHFAVED